MTFVDVSWKLDAGCRDTDPALFFSSNKETIAWAKETCAACPVQADCLAYAIGINASGVWGGTDEDERHEMGGPRIISPDLKPVPCSVCGTPFARRSSSHRTCSEPCWKEARRAYRRGWDQRRREQAEQQERETA